MIFAVACVVTPVVVIEKVEVVALAATVTLAGTCAAALSLLRLTEIPPLGAGEVKVTVPCEPMPPTTLFGFSAKELIVIGGRTANVAVCELPL